MVELTSGTVYIDSKIPIEQILDLSIIAKVDNHAEMNFRGIVTDAMIYNFPRLEKEKISIIFRKAEVEETLFTGYIEQYIIQREADYNVITIYSKSLTSQIDEIQELNFFQNIHQTYRDLLMEVIRSYGWIGVGSQYNQETQRVFLQYKESTWSFIKRIASHMGVFVIPDITSDNLQMVVGEPLLVL